MFVRPGRLHSVSLTLSPSLSLTLRPGRLDSCQSALKTATVEMRVVADAPTPPPAPLLATPSPSLSPAHTLTPVPASADEVIQTPERPLGPIDANAKYKGGGVYDMLLGPIDANAKANSDTVAHDKAVRDKAQKTKEEQNKAAGAKAAREKAHRQRAEEVMADAPQRTLALALAVVVDLMECTHVSDVAWNAVLLPVTMTISATKSPPLPLPCVSGPGCVGGYGRTGEGCE